MIKKIQLFVLGLVILVFTSCKEKTDYDICVYGGTSAGVIAAYSAKKMGKSVLLIEPRLHLGGMTASGLGATDIGNKYAITGLARNFYRRLGAHYGKLEAWEFEPKVAEKIFNNYIQEAGVEVLYWHRLHAVTKKGKKIISIEVENTKAPNKATNKVVSAKMFIDCSYEGDLMAKAGVSYTIGREDNAQYGETLNGVQLHDKHQFVDGISPYVIPGDSSSGLVYGVSSEKMAPVGSGDSKVQAYNYRLCLTQDTNNFVPITRPEGYDSNRFELVRRVINHYHSIGWGMKIPGFFLRVVHMPNMKSDMNNHGSMSTDYIGMNYDYPEAGYDRRREIEKDHELYIRSYLYFLTSDLAVPDNVQKEMRSWGWPKDEFTDNNHFPFQLYVREARRMIGEYVMTQHDCEGKTQIHDPVGIGAYNMDSHNAQRIVVNGMVKNEGDVQVSVDPYPISYRSIIPQRKECSNLLVPVCLSATHIAYGSIRMEPVFMVLGQAAAVAASMAIDANTAVQKIAVDKLIATLQDNPLLDGTVPEIVIDDSDTLLVHPVGNWVKQTKVMQYKKYCLYSEKADGNERRVRFSMPEKIKGHYQVYFYFPCKGSKKNFFVEAHHVPLKIKSATEEKTILFNYSDFRCEWMPLGSMILDADSYFEIVADTVEGGGTADALLLIPVSET